jgi:transcriptional regulator with XRE-family HTH domain
MNKFATWVYDNHKKQRGVAEKLGVSTSTLHDILRKDLVPSLKVAYEIEKYTNGDITLYDWIDNIKAKKGATGQVVSKEKRNKVAQQT